MEETGSFPMGDRPSKASRQALVKDRLRKVESAPTTSSPDGTCVISPSLSLPKKGHAVGVRHKSPEKCRLLPEIRLGVLVFGVFGRLDLSVAALLRKLSRALAHRAQHVSRGEG